MTKSSKRFFSLLGVLVVISISLPIVLLANLSLRKHRWANQMQSLKVSVHDGGEKFDAADAGPGFIQSTFGPFQVIEFRSGHPSILVSCPWPGSKEKDKPWHIDAENIHGCKLENGATLDDVVRSFLLMQEAAEK